MTLLQFISTLSTQNVNVTVKDGDSDTEIIQFKSQGYQGVESDVSARTVKRWEVTGAAAIMVVLNAAA